MKENNLIINKNKYHSYSSIACFMDCRRKYYWSNIRNLEKIRYAPYFIVGNAIDLGVSLLYAKDKDYLKKVLKTYNKAKQELRGSMNLKIEQEQDLNEQQEIIIGMLGAYKEIHKDHIKKLKHEQKQYEAIVPVSNFAIKIKVDNIIKNKKETFIHELKTTRTLTPDYVKNIKNDLQTAIYFHMYNKLNKDNKLAGIVYDVIQKPSIRQKQKETKEQFINRLKDWYKGPENVDKYYMETINTPLIDKNRIINILTKVNADIKKCLTLNDFYPNERFCYVYSKCEFYDICHEGEKPELMANFRQRDHDIKKKGGKNDKRTIS